jgi:uncharacterized protein YbbK (DUF523 family)
MIRILVSACLLGQRVRYDGTAAGQESDHLVRWSEELRIVPFCPEVEAGLGIPRLPAEIDPGARGAEVLAGAARIRRSDGGDVTEAFLRGAKRALETALAAGVKLAVLKDRSPSCGSVFIHDGSFSGQIRAGQGVTAALLAGHGIKVCSEQQIEQAAAHLRTLEDSKPPQGSSRCGPATRTSACAR